MDPNRRQYSRVRAEMKVTIRAGEVSVVDENIISAVIDNQWDELNQITCNTAQC